MSSLASELASLIWAILSRGVYTLGGSPGRLGDEFSNFVRALITEGKRQGFGRVVWRTPSVFKQFLPVILYAGSVLILIATTILYLSSGSDERSRWELAVWTLLAGVLVSALPLVSRVLLRRWLPRFLLIVVEFLILGVTLALFTTLVLKLPLRHPWILYAAGLIALLTGGGLWVEFVHSQTERNLLEEWNTPDAPPASGGPSRQTVSSQLELIKRDFNWELIVYSALPLGIPLGLFIGLQSGPTLLEVVSICLRWVFGLASVFLLYFLQASCRRMMVPTLRVLPAGVLEQGTDAARDWGCVLTDYRKMFLADLIENTVLLIAFGLLTWRLYGPHNPVALDLKFITVVVVVSIAVNELPYLIGQWRVHEKLVSSFQGWQKLTKLKEATEHIPLVPKFEFIAALISEASAGGLALEFMKKITELTAKT